VTYEDLGRGRTREIIERPNGVTVYTVRDAGGYVLRRVKEYPDGQRVVLYDFRDDNRRERINYDRRLDPIRVDIPRERYIVSARRADRRLFYDTLAADPVEVTEDRYTLREIRENERLRAKVRRVDLDTINFATGSAYVSESQVAYLGDVAGAMLDVIDQDPSAVFFIEGHTDAVGSDLSNLTLSDRRAEAVGRILSDAYDVPPENLVIQGYGEEYLKVQTEGPSAANRRVTIRNISPLLAASKQ
jgi:outer membrane protein OmpA-like peptidoglycan-associated protein